MLFYAQFEASLLTLVLYLSSINCQNAAPANSLNSLLSRTTALKSKLQAATVEFKRNTAGNRHLNLEFISQTAWINAFTKRLARVNQKALKSVELHLLQEALLHRENRLDEELAIIRQIGKTFKSKGRSLPHFLTYIQGRLVHYLEVYSRVPTVYRQVVWGAIDEVKHLIEEIQDSAKKTPSAKELTDWEQTVARIEATMKNVVEYRIHSTIHDREFYN